MKGLVRVEIIYFFC